MEREELMTLLPHRDKMLLLDRAWLEGETAHGEYRVRGDEWFLQGHFPGHPVVPGVVLCEILAQSACLLLGQQAQGRTPYLTGLEQVRFRRPVQPGDTISTQCSLTKARTPFYFVSGSAAVGDENCLKADFSFALMPGTEAVHE